MSYLRSAMKAWREDPETQRRMDDLVGEISLRQIVAEGRLECYRRELEIYRGALDHLGHLAHSRHDREVLKVVNNALMKGGEVR